jgi:hypothetical protein
MLVEREKMNLSASVGKDRLLYWMAGVLLLITFGMVDAGVIAWCASLIDFGQLFAAVFSLLLIETGLFFTVWQMRR